MQCGVTASIAECSHVTLVLFLIGNRWTRAYFALSLCLSVDKVMAAVTEKTAVTFAGA